MLDDLPLHEMKDLYQGNQESHHENFVPTTESFLGNLVTLRETEAKSFAPYGMLQSYFSQ